VNVLIIGENKHNNHVREYLTQNGMDVYDVSDVYRLRSVTGEVGNFRVDTKEDDGVEDLHFCEIDFMILTEQPTAKPVEIEGLSVLPLYADKVFDAPARTAALDPIVFLLDYVNESPMSATISALSDAVTFARKKRKVFYLSKFVRTAGRGIEALYREAREAGVTFIKYEALEIKTDLNKEEFSFVVSDGEFDLEIKTKAVYADGGRDVGERFSYAVKKLNLTTDKYGYLTVDTFYLTPVLTSRRGVFHLTRDLAAERLDEGLDYICAVVMSGVEGISPPDVFSHGIAVIDGLKCVFCYNCYRTCPHAALEPDQKESRMQCLSAACSGCGTCESICPANAISLENSEAFVEDTLYESNKAYESNTMYESVKTGRSLVVCCENSGGATIENVDNIDVLTVPCGGAIDVSQLSQSLYEYEKLLAVVCPDDACRHFNGNKRACAQVKHLQDLLESAGLSTDRIKVVHASQALPNVLRDEINAFFLIP